MSQRKAVTKTIATRYVRADRGAKKVILDELCATTGWHRDHARKALRQALVLRVVKAPRRLREPIYGEDPYPGNMPGITLEIDPNLAASGSNYSSLVFVPASIAAGQWVTMDATKASQGVWFLTGDAGAKTGCQAVAPFCSFDEVQAALEDNDGNEAVVTFGVTVKVASPYPFSGAVDDLIINTQTFDFEPFGVSVS